MFEKIKIKISLSSKYSKIRKEKNNILFKIGIFPMGQFVQLETTSYCNRSCWFCMRKNDRSGIRKDADGNPVVKRMPTWKVIDILNQLQGLGYKGIVWFHRNNEPLIDERIFKFAFAAKQRGMLPCIYTNGDLIRSGDQNFADLVAEHFDFIVIGQYDISNEQERQEDQFELSYKLRKARRIKFSGGIRVPDVNMDEEKFKQKYECSMADFAQQARNKPCDEPLIRLIIRYDGEITQCCRTDTISIGSVYKNSIKEIWWSKPHINFVKDLLKPDNRYKYEFCKICPSGGDFPGHIKQRIKKEQKNKKNYYYCTPKWIEKTENTNS